MIKVNQLATEWLVIPSPSMRVTNTAVEMVVTGTVSFANMRVTGLALEAALSNNVPNVRLTELAIERVLQNSPTAPVRFTQVVLERLMTRKQTLIGTTGIPSNQAFGPANDGYLISDEDIPLIGSNSAELGIAFLGSVLLGSTSSIEPSIEIIGVSGGPISQGFGNGGSFSWGPYKAGGFDADCETTVSLDGFRQTYGHLVAYAAATVQIGSIQVTRYGKIAVACATAFSVLRTNQKYAALIQMTGVGALNIVRFNFADGNCQFNANGTSALALRPGIHWSSGTSWHAAGLAAAAITRGAVDYATRVGPFAAVGGMFITRSAVDYSMLVGPFAAAGGMAITETNQYYSAHVNLYGMGGLFLTGNVQWGYGMGFRGTGASALSIRAAVDWAEGTSWVGAGKTSVQIFGGAIFLNRWSAAGCGGLSMRGAGIQNAYMTVTAYGALRLGFMKSHAVSFGDTIAVTFTPNLITPEAGYYYWIARRDSRVYPDVTPGSFTVAGKTARWENFNTGFFIKKTGLGLPSHPTIKRPFNWVKGVHTDYEVFGFVDYGSTMAEIDNTETFTDSGKVGRGHSSQFGRFTQKNVYMTEVQAMLVTQVAVETLGTNTAGTRATQVAVEVLGGNAARVRTTQVAIETLKLANFATVKQIAVEALGTGLEPPPAQVKQVAIEVLATSHAGMVLSQLTEEALLGERYGGPLAGKVRGSQVAVEVLRLRTEPSLANDRVKQVGVEMMSSGVPYALVQNVGVEAVVTGAPAALIQDIGVEAVVTGAPAALIQDIGIEMVYDTNPNAMVKQVAVEYLVKATFDGTVGGLVGNPRYHT